MKDDVLMILDCTDTQLDIVIEQFSDSRPQQTSHSRGQQTIS